VAGVAGGHDMAVVLNEVYVLLSDPAARLAYDQEQARCSEFSGYTGLPLYSSWLGPDSERRAVFVDEVRCVGCLKCSLQASWTFAVESVSRFWDSKAEKIRCPPNWANFGKFRKFGMGFTHNLIKFGKILIKFEIKPCDSCLRVTPKNFKSLN
jgi:hypothetical protein